MKYLIFIIILIAISGCGMVHIYNLPEDVPSFYDLGIDTQEFNSIDKVIIYAETNIKTIIKDEECGIFPWDAMVYRQGDILDKCVLISWMCEEAELIEEAFIVLSGPKYYLRSWHVEDELGNPIWNYDEKNINIYEKRRLSSLLYEYSLNNCFRKSFISKNDSREDVPSINIHSFSQEHRVFGYSMLPTSEINQVFEYRNKSTRDEDYEHILTIVTGCHSKSSIMEQAIEELRKSHISKPDMEAEA